MERWRSGDWRQIQTYGERETKRDGNIHYEREKLKRERDGE